MSEPLVCVVDDDAAVRTSVKMLLEAADHKVHVFSGAREFLDARTSIQCACLIADIRMPDMDGLTLQEELVRQKAEIPVIIITGHGDVPLAVRAMKAGAIDFIEKPFSHAVLLGAVTRALASSRDVPVTARSAELAARVASLSERERQVLDRLVAGKANKVIAQELVISPRTVEVYRANVMDKMQAKNLSELVRLAIGAGIDIAG